MSSCRLRTAFRLACLAPLLLSGCRAIPAPGVASNRRDWRPEFDVLAEADWEDERRVTVRNIRNCSYFTEEIYVVDHYDRTFDVNRLQGVDFIVVPFKQAPTLAHTMLSFEFAGEQPDDPPEHLAVSVEARLEKGEEYSPLKGSARQFELMYVVADERDVLPLRTEHRDVDVYLYRVQAPPERVRALFRDVMQRVNTLADEPEFYDTLNNNCTNNISRHINKLSPGRVPWDLRITLPGLSDHLAYDLGLLDTTRPFEELKREARINPAAKRAVGREDFSVAIRRGAALR